MIEHTVSVVVQLGPQDDTLFQLTKVCWCVAHMLPSSTPGTSLYHFMQFIVVLYNTCAGLGHHELFCVMLHVQLKLPRVTPASHPCESPCCYMLAALLLVSHSHRWSVGP